MIALNLKLHGTCLLVLVVPVCSSRIPQGQGSIGTAAELTHQGHRRGHWSAFAVRLPPS
jgi:hypothetical protein